MRRGAQCAPVQFGCNVRFCGRTMFAPTATVWLRVVATSSTPRQVRVYYGRIWNPPLRTTKKPQQTIEITNRPTVECWPRAGASVSALGFLRETARSAARTAKRAEPFPLSRAPRLGSSGTFLVLFWSQKSTPIGQHPTKKGRCRKVATPVKHKQKTKINPNKSPWPLQHSTCRNRPAHRGSCPPHPPKDLRSHGG